MKYFISYSVISVGTTWPGGPDSIGMRQPVHTVGCLQVDRTQPISGMGDIEDIQAIIFEERKGEFNRPKSYGPIAIRVTGWQRFEEPLKGKAELCTQNIALPKSYFDPRKTKRPQRRTVFGDPIGRKQSR